MTTTAEYHNMAMEFADLGDRNRRRGADEIALAYFEQALDFELAAIANVERAKRPVGAVLLRSAGALALACRRFCLVERLVAQALAGEPPPYIAAELRDLRAQIQFRRHPGRNRVAP